MSRYHRVRLLNTTELLANAMLRIPNTAKEELPALLSDMQDLALAMGQLIEDLKGQGTKSVGLLENICENLYQISLGASGEEENNHLLDLGQNLVALRDAVSEEFPDKKEVVFLPYNASMWDSLESVWKRAAADPETEAIVMPIPFYEKNADEKLHTYHYEGDRYPSDVPIVDYKKYDLKLHHPDEIYIHNPYDDWNNVTSVDPDYYSSRIKDYTEKLVYIPYFVLAEPDPNQKALGKIADFARMPGVLNAHQVIVQSENMRLCYIRALVDQFGEDTRPTWEKKILGSGSPKLEKIKSLAKEKTQLPIEWKDKVYKPDGSKKKIVLYNTSVDAFAKNGRPMLEKIKSSLGIFYEHRDSVALLWRPHPLMETTISSMYPELWQEYCRVVKDYRDGDWGIYDDSSELDRAIGLADAYYGDRSSLVQLCQGVGMPVMIQNVEIIAYEKN